MSWGKLNINCFKSVPTDIIITVEDSNGDPVIVNPFGVTRIELFVRHEVVSFETVDLTWVNERFEGEVPALDMVAIKYPLVWQSADKILAVGSLTLSDQNTDNRQTVSATLTVVDSETYEITLGDSDTAVLLAEAAADRAEVAEAGAVAAQRWEVDGATKIKPVDAKKVDASHIDNLPEAGTSEGDDAISFSKKIISPITATIPNAYPASDLMGSVVSFIFDGHYNEIVKDNGRSGGFPAGGFKSIFDTLGVKFGISLSATSYGTADLMTLQELLDCQTEGNEMMVHLHRNNNLDKTEDEASDIIKGRIDGYTASGFTIKNGNWYQGGSDIAWRSAARKHLRSVGQVGAAVDFNTRPIRSFLLYRRSFDAGDYNIWIQRFEEAYAAKSFAIYYGHTYTADWYTTLKDDDGDVVGDYAAFNGAITYDIDDKVVYDDGTGDKYYKCIQATTDPEFQLPTDAAYWTEQAFDYTWQKIQRLIEYIQAKADYGDREGVEIKTVNEALDDFESAIEYGDRTVGDYFAVSKTGDIGIKTHDKNNVDINKLTNRLHIGDEFVKVGFNAGLESTDTEIQATGCQAGFGATGEKGTYHGYQAGRLNTGEFCTFIGHRSGLNNTGIRSTLVGYAAGLNNTGLRLSAFGYGAGNGNTGGQCSFFGFEAGNGNTNADVCGFGYVAGATYRSSFFGSRAGNGAIGGQLSAVGYYALAAATGQRGTGIGFEAGRSSTGNNSVYIGYQAGKSNTEASVLLVEHRSDSAANPLIKGYFTTGAIILGAPATAVADANMGNSRVSFYLDEAGDLLKFKVKYADGTVKNGEVALT